MTPNKQKTKQRTGRNEKKGLGTNLMDVTLPHFVFVGICTISIIFVEINRLARDFLLGMVPMVSTSVENMSSRDIARTTCNLEAHELVRTEWKIVLL